MINLRTLLSTFDEKGTLLKWLKKVETALTNAALESVQVVIVDETHIKMKFVFADGTFVESPSITLPRGPQGEQGIQGPVGPQGVPGTVSLDSLIALLEGSEFISVDLNEQSTKVRVELDMTKVDETPTVNSGNLVKSGGVYTEINRVENETETALAGKQGVIDATHKLSADNVDDSVTANKFVSSEEKSTWNGKQNALTTSSVNDGTIDKSIGFDNQGNIVKGNAGGGGGGGIGGGFTLIINGNVNAPIYVLCGNLSYKNQLNENISENWYGWHKITDTYTTATCNNTMCFSVSGTTFKATGVSNSTNIRDFTGASLGSSIELNKMYYLLGELTMMSDD